MNDTETWDLIHRERSAMADTLATLAPEDWARPSLCAGWSVQIAAGHIVAGAEQTRSHFVTRFAANGFRFNTTMDSEARRVGAAAPADIIERLRITTNTTNRPPAPLMTMLSEIVVHSEDVRGPLGIAGSPPPEALAAVLELNARANFPIGTKKRIAGLRLVASDLDWSHGSGPPVSGPAMSLLMAMTGRRIAVNGLDGDGAAALKARIPTVN